MTVRLGSIPVAKAARGSVMATDAGRATLDLLWLSDLLWFEIGSKGCDVGALPQRVEHESDVKGRTIESRAPDGSGEPS